MAFGGMTALRTTIVALQSTPPMLRGSAKTRSDGGPERYGTLGVRRTAPNTTVQISKSINHLHSGAFLVRRLCLADAPRSPTLGFLDSIRDIHRYLIKKSYRYGLACSRQILATSESRARSLRVK